MRTAILVGCFAPYLDPLLPGEEVWCANLSVRDNPDAARVYALDPMSRFLLSPTRRAEFLATFAKVPKVFLQEHVPEVPHSQAYPLAEVLATFGTAYFTSTVAYMIAHAMLEKVDRIVMHRVYVLPSSMEYLGQAACINFWLGRALGMGIQVEITEGSHLCRPAPWQAPMYGFNDFLSENYVDRMLASAATLAMPIPVRFGSSPIADPLVKSMSPAIPRRSVPPAPPRGALDAVRA